MPRVNWDSTGERYYEAGVDRGVLYTPGNSGVPWSGLMSISEKPSGGAAVAYYLDGEKYLNVSAKEEYAATIEAYTYPDEFQVCDGTASADTGLFVAHQPRQPFSLSYRTMIGNDISDSVGYKLHLIYNALAAPSGRDNVALSDTPTPSNFSWEVTTKPPAMPGFKPSAHVIIDTRVAHPGSVSDVEDILYGTDSTSARMPDLDELITVFETNAYFIVIDNGDGTFTATAPDDLDAIIEVDSTHYTITWSSVVQIGDTDEYTLSSL